MRTLAQKIFRFFDIFGVPARTGVGEGQASANILQTRDESIFCDFVSTSFMDGPLRALQSQQSKPLPIFVSGKDVTKLLAISKLKSGKMYVYAEIGLIDRWGIANLISAMCFDMTIK